MIFMKKLWLIFILFFSLSGCLIEEPKIDIHDIRLDGISEGKIKLKIILDVYNPNPFDIGVKFIEYKVYFDKNLFSDGIWEGDEKINSKSKVTIPVPITADENIVIKFISLVLTGKVQEIQNKINVEGRAVLNNLAEILAMISNGNIRIKRKTLRKV